MKKLIAIMALTFMIACVGCGDKTDGSTTEKTSSNIVVEASSTADGTTVTESASVDESAVATEAVVGEDKDYVNWWGLSMYCPKEYLSDSGLGFPQYYVLDGSDTKKNMVFFTYDYPGADTMTPESVIDLMNENDDIADSGLSAEYSGEIIKENEIQKEEKVNVNGCECIRQEGILHCDDYVEPHDYFYVAYFGVIDFPMQGKQPAMMIAFTHNLDDATKAEVIHDIDTAAQNAAPIEDSIT